MAPSWPWRIYPQVHLAKPQEQLDHSGEAHTPTSHTLHNIQPQHAPRPQIKGGHMLESLRQQCYKTECQDPPPDVTTCSQGEMESCLRCLEVPKKSKQGHRDEDQQALSLPSAPGKTVCKSWSPANFSFQLWILGTSQSNPALPCTGCYLVLVLGPTESPTSQYSHL